MALHGGDESNGARIIFVGEGLNGENLYATEEEKINYINSISSDMYIRVEIYDNDDKEAVTSIGYYTKENYEVAKAIAKNFEQETLSEEKYNNDTWLKEQYSSYEEYKNKISEYNKDLTLKLPNEYIENNSKVPTIINFTGHRMKENGRYIVEAGSYNEIFAFYPDEEKNNEAPVALALKTDSAQKMIKSNKEKNENTKKDAEDKITNIKLINDEKNIQEEIKKKNIVLVEEKSVFLNKDIMIYGSIACGILICIITIIIDKNKKRKGEKEDGRKEEKQ